MLAGLTYKQRNLILLVGSILFGIIAYHFSFAETISLIANADSSKEQLISSQNADKEIVRLEQELNEVEAMLGDAKNKDDFQQLLLEKVAHYCENQLLDLSRFPSPHISIEKTEI